VAGCSAHNECALVRALPGDYDAWATPGWGDADLAPLADDIARAVPTRVSRDDELASWQRAFLDAALGAGFPRLADPDGAAGVGPFVQNIKDGIRWNAAFSFLGALSRC
jgi:choline dehydrogenase